VVAAERELRLVTLLCRSTLMISDPYTTELGDLGDLAVMGSALGQDRRAGELVLTKIRGRAGFLGNSSSNRSAYLV
jgi:hypothetical protein